MLLCRLQQASKGIIVTVVRRLRETTINRKEWASGSERKPYFLGE